MKDGWIKSGLKRLRVEKPELMMQVGDAHGYFLAASTGVDNCLLKVYVQKSLLRNVHKRNVYTRPHWRTSATKFNATLLLTAKKWETSQLPITSRVDNDSFERKWENDLQLYAVLWILLVMLSKKKPGAKHYRLVIPFMRSSKKAKLREVRVSATTGREIRGTSEMLTICWLPGCVSLWKVHTIYLQYVPFNVYHRTLIKV